MAMFAGTAYFLIREVLPRLAARRNVLSIARMSMRWAPEDIVEVLASRGESHDAAQFEALRAGPPVYSTREFFGLLGFGAYDDVDFDPEAATIVHDLNSPLPDRFEDRYDLVVENGTIEHIFDIRSAVSNIARTVRTGGILCHVSPLDALNHGFYNFSVNFFQDFYCGNGFGEAQFYLLRYSRDWEEDEHVDIQPLPYTHEEFHFPPEVHTSKYAKHHIGFVARKLRHVPQPRVPIQAAYDPALGLRSRLSK